MEYYMVQAFICTQNWLHGYSGGNILFLLYNYKLSNYITLTQSDTIFFCDDIL